MPSIIEVEQSFQCFHGTQQTSNSSSLTHDCFYAKKHGEIMAATPIYICVTS